METLKFKTNIKCSGCIAKATPFLNEAAGEDNWTVDIQNPEKILSINAENEMSAEEVIKVVNDAGYQATLIKSDAIGKE